MDFVYWLVPVLVRLMQDHADWYIMLPQLFTAFILGRSESYQMAVVSKEEVVLLVCECVVGVVVDGEMSHHPLVNGMVL